MAANYTPNETALLKILHRQKGKPITTVKIVTLRYPDETTRPKYAREAVVTVLNTLIRKAKSKREAFKIMKSERRGPYPTTYWIA